MSIMKWIIKDTVEEAVSHAAWKAAQPHMEASANRAAKEALEEAAKNNPEVQAALEASKRLKVCQSCGTNCDVSMNFCTNCGAKLPELAIGAGFYCPNCGRQNTDEAKFCVGCGRQLNH